MLSKTNAKGTCVGNTVSSRGLSLFSEEIAPALLIFETSGIEKKAKLLASKYAGHLSFAYCAVEKQLLFFLPVVCLLLVFLIVVFFSNSRCSKQMW